MDMSGHLHLSGQRYGGGGGTAKGIYTLKCLFLSGTDQLAVGEVIPPTQALSS